MTGFKHAFTNIILLTQLIITKGFIILSLLFKSLGTDKSNSNIRKTKFVGIISEYKAQHPAGGGEYSFHF